MIDCKDLIKGIISQKVIHDPQTTRTLLIVGRLYAFHLELLSL